MSQRLQFAWIVLVVGALAALLLLWSSHPGSVNAQPQPGSPSAPVVASGMTIRMLTITHIGESDRPIFPMILTNTAVLSTQSTTLIPMSTSEMDAIRKSLEGGGIASAPPPGLDYGTLEWRFRTEQQEVKWTTGRSESEKFLRALLGLVPPGRADFDQELKGLIRALKR